MDDYVQVLFREPIASNSTTLGSLDQPRTRLGQRAVGRRLGKCGIDLIDDLILKPISAAVR